MPRQVILKLLHAGRKYQTPWIDTASGRLFPQVLLRRRIAAQPQYTALDRLQQPHPYIEHLRRDLPIVVERTEDKALFRQTSLRPRRRADSDLSPTVVRLK